MRIQNGLPQFEEHPVLFIVSSKHEAQFYRAYQGNLEQIHEFKIEKQQYSDREGFYMSRGQYQSGSISREHHEDKDRFLNEFRNSLKNIKAHEFKEIILCVPKDAAGYIQKNFTKQDLEKISCVLLGNYTTIHPFEILEKVKIMHSRKHVDVMDGDAHRLEKIHQQAEKTESTDKP